MAETKFLEKVRKVSEPIALHFIAMTLTILSIWGFHLILRYSLGEGAKLFDRLPVIYIAQVGDAVAFLRFIWSAIREFKDV